MALSPPLLPRIHTSSVGALAGHDVGLGAAVVAVRAGEQGEDVVDLLGVVRRLGAGLLQQRALQREARRADEVGERERRRDQQPLGGAVGGAGARRRRRRAAAEARAAEAEVDAAGVQGVDDAELLDDRQRRVVAHLHGAGADADALGGRRRRAR